MPLRWSPHHEKSCSAFAGRRASSCRLRHHDFQFGIRPVRNSSPTPADNSYNGEHSADLDVTSQMRASMSAQSDGSTIKVYASVFDVSTNSPITALDLRRFFSPPPLAPAIRSCSCLESYTDAFQRSLCSVTSGGHRRTRRHHRVRSAERTNQRAAHHRSCARAVLDRVDADRFHRVRLAAGVDSSGRPIPNDDILVEATGSCLSRRLRAKAAPMSSRIPTA